jgi:hypothetical protein
MAMERIRELERAHRADPQDLVLLRELAEERKRRGEELLPDVVRPDPLYLARWARHLNALRDASRSALWIALPYKGEGAITLQVGNRHLTARLPNSGPEWRRFQAVLPLEGAASELELTVQPRDGGDVLVDVDELRTVRTEWGELEGWTATARISDPP